MGIKEHNRLKETIKNFMKFYETQLIFMKKQLIFSEKQLIFIKLIIEF